LASYSVKEGVERSFHALVMSQIPLAKVKIGPK
jgi:hypothetical protein